MKPGDVVRLKSGGPAMTVERVTEPDASSVGEGRLVECVCFVEVSGAHAVVGRERWDGPFHSRFPAEALELA